MSTGNTPALAAGWCRGTDGSRLIVFPVRPDCPRGGSSIQRLPALARRQPPLGRSELRQSQGHGGGEHRSLLAGPQDTLVAPGQLRARRVLAGDPAEAAVLDLPVFGALLPQTAAQNQRRPGQRVRRGRHSRHVSVRGRWVGTLRASLGGLWDFAPFLSCFNFLFFTLQWNLSFLGPVLKRSQLLQRLFDFSSPKAPKTSFLKQSLRSFFFFNRILKNFEVKRH